MSTYTVRYERDERGWWVARVVGLPGCHTQGRSIEQARERTREALALFVADADRADLIDDFVLPPGHRSLLSELLRARARAESAEAAAHSLMSVAVRELIDRLRLSYRDIGALVNVSHQRVQQIAAQAPREAQARAPMARPTAPRRRPAARAAAR
jgi:predicted RNase H-like HicB family nuclease